jgi:hypothetical protein
LSEAVDELIVGKLSSYIHAAVKYIVPREIVARHVGYNQKGTAGFFVNVFHLAYYKRKVAGLIYWAETTHSFVS